MCRSFILMVVLTLSSCILVPDFPLPIEYQIHDGVSKEGVEYILQATDEANTSLGRLYGEDILIHNKERFVDPDGFNLDNLTDGHRVIYEIHVDSDIYHRITQGLPYEHGITGGVTQEDIFIVRGGISELAGVERWYEHTILHELGHWTGMIHREQDEETSVMSYWVNDIIEFSPEDKQAFCLAQDLKTDECDELFDELFSNDGISF